MDLNCTKSFIKLLSVLWIVIGILFSCKKTESDPVPASVSPKPLEPTNPITDSVAKDTTKPLVPTKYGTLKFHLHTFVGETEVEGYTYHYSNEDGRKISLDLIQLYISEIELIKADRSSIKVPNVTLFKNLEELSYTVGQVPVGTYQSIRFSVGLPDSLNNIEEFSAQPSAINNKSSMWFETSPKANRYVFFHLSGKIDTTADASGSVHQMQSFVFKIGGTEKKQIIQMPLSAFTIVENQSLYKHMYVDVNLLFRGLDLHKPESLRIESFADNSSDVAQIVFNNLSSVFKYE
jgi:hypothetical protein